MFELFSIVLAAMFAGSDSSSSPKITIAKLMLLPPPEPPVEDPPPPRMPVPGAKWYERSGEIRVEQMAASPRFPAAPAGYQRVVLATLVDHNGRTALKPQRIVCDVFVEDTTDAASIVELNMALGNKKKPKIIPAWHHSSWGERLVRKFTPQHDDYIGKASYEGAFPLPTQLPTTPNVPLFTSDHCKTFDVSENTVANEWRETLREWGVDVGDRFYWFFDPATCGANGMAYHSRTSTKDGKKYLRIYNLKLEADAGEIVLTAEIARLPVTQVLKWRCYFALT